MKTKIVSLRLAHLMPQLLTSATCFFARYHYYVGHSINRPYLLHVGWTAGSSCSPSLVRTKMFVRRVQRRWNSSVCKTPCFIYHTCARNMNNEKNDATQLEIVPAWPSVAVVTGASRGLGQAISRFLARNGVCVAGTTFFLTFSRKVSALLLFQSNSSCCSSLFWFLTFCRPVKKQSQCRD